jgi:hypothetical protein
VETRALHLGFATWHRERDFHARHVKSFPAQRICPDRKISQLGLVVSLAMSFKNHAVGPKLVTGQFAEDACKALFETGMSINLEGG